MKRQQLLLCVSGLLGSLFVCADDSETLPMMVESYKNEQQYFLQEAKTRQQALEQLRQQIDYGAKVKVMQDKAVDNLKLLQEGVKQAFSKKTFKSAKIALKMVSNYTDAKSAEMAIGSMAIDESAIKQKIFETQKKINTALANAAIAGQVAAEAQAALDKLPASATPPKQFEWVQTALGKVAEAQQRKDARDKAAAEAAQKAGNDDGTEKIHGKSATGSGVEVEGGEIDDPDFTIEIKPKG